MKQPPPVEYCPPAYAHYALRWSPSQWDIKTSPTIAGEVMIQGRKKKRKGKS